MTCSIIIINYNTKQLTTDCIHSVKKYTEGISHEIILVDNASTDGSKEYFENFEGIKYIYSDTNLGFGRANNLGVQHAEGEFLLFLNSDTLLIEDSITKLHSFFVSHEDQLNIGVLGCPLIDKDHNINGYGNTFPTCIKEKNKVWKQIPFISSFIPLQEEKVYDFSKTYFEIDYVIGADMFMRKSLFDKLHGFFHEFFMYYEETDLQKRISNLGYKQYIYTKTNIIHLEEASSKTIVNYSNKKRIMTHTSRVLYLKRNDRKRFSMFVIADYLFLILNFLNFKYTFRENWKYFTEIIKTY
ncbi:glycosyltransferase family 2 protein [Chryseobacterium sp. SL1]|uniref:glycosyltransferase family 2 protein n=1 Tax=Chryseobacterium sp. SL1 TaxID=2995159 RepID=UPI00227D531E|nr:glycosyltransferase family 2 protein [Chryseobacterium sp. SL1]